MDNTNNLKTLTRQTSSVFCCINYPIYKGLFNLKAYNLSDLYETLSLNMFLFAFRVHDRDVNDDGELKTPHIHVFIKAQKRHQLKYYIYLLADALHCDENLISIKVADSDAGCIQYLVHKNNKEKYQYSIDGVYHNYNQEIFDSLMNCEIVSTITAKELIELCKEHSKLEIIQILGPIKYNQYSKVINEIYKELRLDAMRVKRNNVIYNNNKYRL